MTYGVRTFDEAGNIILDTNSRMGRVLGTAQSGTTPGSLVHAGFAVGEPFCIVIPTGTGVQWGTPLVSFSGTTMSWSWPRAAKTNCKLLYGVY